MDVLPGNIYVLKEILVHEVVVRLLVRDRQADVLVQVERGHLGEIQALCLMHAHQFLVQAQGARTGGHAQHRIGFGVQCIRDHAGGLAAQFLVTLGNIDFHRSDSIGVKLKSCFTCWAQEVEIRTPIFNLSQPPWQAPPAWVDPAGGLE